LTLSKLCCRVCICNRKGVKNVTTRVAYQAVESASRA